ncbi:MAG: hypothetical protein H6727_04455 [Myxococcales bacterium]|nr:hypothetical protein [Myxococcales bacterium]
MKYSLRKNLVYILFFSFLFASTQTGCSFGKLFARKKSASTLRKEKRAQESAKGAEALAKLKAGAPCAQFEELAKLAMKAPISREMRKNNTWASVDEKYLPIAEVAAKCGKWDYVFVHTARINGKPFKRVMKGLQAKGHDAHAAYDTWLNNQPHPYFNVGYGNYSLRSIRDWLQNSEESAQKSHCPAFAKAAKRTYDKAAGEGKLSYVANEYNRKWSRFFRSGFMGYLYVADCQQHIALARGMLTSDVWQDRSQGCDILAKWGKNKDLKKLRILASTDDYSYRKGIHRIWPVRDICRKAAGRVSMRN